MGWPRQGKGDLYAREPGWIEQFHRDARQAITTHDVRVVAERDPAWKAFDKVVGAFLPLTGCEPIHRGIHRS